MDINSSSFNLPSDFIMPAKHKALATSDGVSTFDYGVQGYVGWRFAWSARPWKEEKVKKFRLEGSDNVPVILFYRNKDNQVPIRLKRIMYFEDRVNRWGEAFDKAVPMQLTESEKEAGKTEIDLYELPQGFDSEVFQVAFERFKLRANNQGTPLSSWRANPGQVNTLAAMGIFTVDALGELSEEAFQAKIRQLPKPIQAPLLELHEMAIIFVETYSGRFDAEKFGDKLEALESSNSLLKEELENKSAEVQELLAKIKGTSSKKSAAKKKKTSAKAKPTSVTVVDGEISGII